ncbi:hypothetical protein F2Q69_00031922 [Brassica cretica]|uniref:Uncharacterized protein n=1 Tax=Brassica cretica TaxID=69181 RepID=A0A8S9S7H6_BRACR|nr:hypothetical protein F2Q69_00031922 [Brassica cretica]
MIKLRCHPEVVQIHGFRSVEVLLDTPPGSPKNCPEARGGSVRVHISLSRPISFFMVKPRLCPSRDQFSPVHSSRPLGFGQVLSDQPAASHLEHSSLAVRKPYPDCSSLIHTAPWSWLTLQCEPRSVEVLLDTPPGSPRKCPEAKGDQSSPVKTFILGFGHVLSDQPAASRLEHCRSPGCDVGTTGPMPYRPDYEY